MPQHNGMRMVAQINLDHIAENMRNIRASVPAHSKIMAVVKADAYGHGAVETAKVLLYNGADQLGVAYGFEGVQLRTHNIHVPILILGYTPLHQLDECVQNRLTQTVFSMDAAKALSERARALGQTADVHIKIDTGMSRLGFLPNEHSLKEIAAIASLSHIRVTGIYSHFATADEADQAFADRQYGRFIAYAGLVQETTGQKLIVHMANSAAILNRTAYAMDMVRPGLILYGLYPSGQRVQDIPLKPCMRIQTTVSNVKTLEKGVGVGYGHTFFTKRETKVATIPVGYADGYGRLLGNKGRILISGRFAPIIGAVCMDQFMADVTDIEAVKPGDEVVLIGRQGTNEITADELARLTGSISYEIICNFGKRVPRVYIKNGGPIRTILKI